MTIDYAAEFAGLGAEIDRQWCREAFHPDAFPGIAAEAAASVTDIDWAGLLIQNYDRLDLSYRFSDFDLHIFASDRFRIEILHWLGGSTSIHQHAFSGAFKLLAGRSLHVEYDFARRHTVLPDLLTGVLKLRRSEILKPGAVRRIDCGSRFIHANFHMVRPTVTMVIRAHCNTVPEPQFDYMPPYIAINPFSHENGRTRQRRLLDVLARTGRWELVEQAIEAVWPEPTLADTLDILKLPVVIGNPARLDRLLARAAERHPTFAAELEAVVREEVRRQKGMLLFRRVAGNDQRFLVALLLNLPDAEAILPHLATEFPGETPAAAAARLLMSIAAVGHLSPMSQMEPESVAALIDGRRPRAETPVLSRLLEEDVLRPLFSRSEAAILDNKSG
jgi:hypothetical protein